MDNQTGIAGSGTIIGIGASAGGVEAISELLRRLPVDLPAAVLVVLHRAPHLPSHLKDILERSTPLDVAMAGEGMVLKAGTCLVSPETHHMMVTPDRRVHLVLDGFYRGNNIDLLFHSLARCAGPHVIGVVLSGLLKDGAMGLRAIKEAGGIALVQSPAEAPYPDMPQNAILQDGPIDRIGDIAVLAEEIVRRCAAAPAAAAIPS